MDQSKEISILNKIESFSKGNDKNYSYDKLNTKKEKRDYSHDYGKKKREEEEKFYFNKGNRNIYEDKPPKKKLNSKLFFNNDDDPFERKSKVSHRNKLISDDNFHYNKKVNYLMVVKLN